MSLMPETAREEQLSVTTLGRFEIYRQQEVLRGGYWNRRKVCDLLKVLLSAEQHRLHTEQILELLWPSSTTEQALNSFRKTLYLLRRALEPTLETGKGATSSYLVLDHDILLLVPDRLTIDADLFEQQAKPLQLKLRTLITKLLSKEEGLALLNEFDQALALYGGEYLPEDLYEDWSQKRRERLRRTHGWLLEQAARLAIEQELGQRASEYLHLLLDSDPTDEQTQRKLMQLYARMGRRNEAGAQYQLLSTTLRQQLETKPLPETTELFEAIQAGQIPVDLPETDAPMLPQPLTQEPIPSPTPPAIPAAEPQTLYTPALAGRNAELMQLQDCALRAFRGETRVFFLSGESGIGKTRLAREYARWAEEEQQARVLWSGCYEQNSMFPYQPVADLISTAISNTDPERLTRLLESSATDLAKIVPELRTQLPESPDSGRMGPEIESRNLYLAVSRFLLALAQEQTLTLLLDDLQWADPATLQLLSYLLTQLSSSWRTAPKKPFFVLLYREEEVNETHPLRDLLAAHIHLGRVQELHLQRLKEADVQQFFLNLTGYEAANQIAQQIYTQTEGNPFLIEETIRSLLHDGSMKLQANVWSTLTTPLTLPQNARLLIERRLLRLSTDCRATLSTAALLGRYFNSSLLCKACQRDEIQVAGHLDDAIQAHILLPLDASLPTGAAPGYSVRDADVAFTHDRLREVLAQSLNPLRRRVIQRQVAQAIEQHYAAQLQAHYSKLAYHYQQADAGPQALDYLMKAAQQAINVYAFVDAADFLEQAVKLLQGTPDQPQRAELLRQLSTDIYLYTGELEKAISTGIASCDLWQELGDGVKEARSCLDLAFAFHWMNQEANAHAYISRALERLSTHPEEKHLLARAHVQWGLIATTMGDAPAALEQLQESDELLSQLEQQDPFILVVSLWSYTWCAYLSGTPRHMLAYARRSIEVCRETRMFGWEPMMTYSAAWAQMLLGDIEGGKQTGQEALTQSIRYNVVGAQGWSNLVLAFLATNEDDWAGADGYIADTLEIADMLRNRDLHSRALWCKSISAGRQGRWEEALVTISSGLQVLAEQNETSMVHPHIELQAATAYFQLGKFREAQRHLATCMDMAQRREYQQLPALALRLRGLILQTQQRHTEAQASFEQSLQRLTALEDTVEYKRTQEVYRQLSPFHSL